jgi:hypothetical protein
MLTAVDPTRRESDDQKKVGFGISGSNPFLAHGRPTHCVCTWPPLCGCSPRHATAPGLDRAADYVRSHLALAGRPLRNKLLSATEKRSETLWSPLAPLTASGSSWAPTTTDATTPPGRMTTPAPWRFFWNWPNIFPRSPLRTRLDLAAYTLEEINPGLPALQGSTEHARKLRQEKVQVKLMIALEMLGYFDDRPGRQKYPFPFMKWFYPSGRKLSGRGGILPGTTLGDSFGAKIPKGIPVAVLWVSGSPMGARN